MVVSCREVLYGSRQVVVSSWYVHMTRRRGAPVVRLAVEVHKFREVHYGFLLAPALACVYGSRSREGAYGCVASWVGARVQFAYAFQLILWLCMQHLEVPVWSLRHRQVPFWFCSGRCAMVSCGVGFICFGAGCLDSPRQGEG